MTEAEIDAFVNYIFTNGFGEKATRLVMMDDETGRDLGGWCRDAIRTLMVRANAAEPAARVPPTPLYAPADAQHRIWMIVFDDPSVDAKTFAGAGAEAAARAAWERYAVSWNCSLLATVDRGDPS